jgi:tetratricopeptide (TPR) repeat protein
MKIRLSILFISFAFCSFGQSNSFEEINKLFGQHKYKETIDLSSNAIKNLDSSETLYKKLVILRASSYMYSSDYKSAIEDWKRLMSIDSIDVINYENISFAYWSIGDNENSLKYINKAYGINPNDAGVLSNMAYDYAELGKYEESIKFANKGLEQKNLQDTLKAMLLNNRGYAFIGLKKYHKAIRDINRSMVFYPNNSFAYYFRALANIGLNKLETVCKDLEKAKSLGGIELTKDLIIKYCK